MRIKICKLKQASKLLVSFLLCDKIWLTLAMIIVVQSLQAPNSPGVYTSTWRMVCPAGYFGDPLWIFMTVGEANQDIDLTRRDVSFESTNDMRFQEWHQGAQGPGPWQQHPDGNGNGGGQGEDEDFMDL